MPKTIVLDQELAVQKGRELHALISLDIRDRQPQVNKRLFVRETYFGHKERQLEYSGQSNIHLHLVTEKIENIVPKISNAFWNADPIVHAMRVGEEFDPDDTETVEQFLNWAIDADIDDFYDTFQSWSRNMLIDAVSTVKTYWNREIRNTVIIERAKNSWRAGETDLTGQPVPEDRPKVPFEILMDVIPGLTDARPEEGSPDPLSDDAIETMAFRVDFVEDRIEYENVLVEFSPAEYIDEIEAYIYRPIVIHNSPVVEVVEFEDLIVPFRTSNLQTAERITHQYWLTKFQIQQKVDSGEWDLSAEELDTWMKATPGAERQEEHIENKRAKRQKDRELGEHSHSAPRTADVQAPYNDSKMLIFEVYVREDLNNDGIGEEVVYQLPHGLKKVVRAQYLEEDFPHGRRPFSSWHHIRVSDRWYGVSLAELLAPINVEVDIIINMVNEAQELINNPFFFYVPTALGVETEILENIKPGQGIPIGDINGVVFPKFPQEPLANLSTMDSLLLFADRLTVSPQASGSSQTRNAPRTARGTLALLSEAGIKMDMLIMSAQRGGWRELIHQIHALYFAFGGDEKWFKVTGETKPRKVSKDSLRGRYDYKFSGNSVNTNREVERSIAQLRYQMLITNPLYAMDMNALLELTKDLIRHFGEGVNQDAITPQLPQGGASHPPMDQKTEIQRMLQGEPLGALPTDDHAKHLEILRKFQLQKDFESLEGWQVALIAVHTNQHAQLMQQQISQGNLTPGGGGSANSAPSGMSQNAGGTDLNALEGGVQ